MSAWQLGYKVGSCNRSALFTPGRFIVAREGAPGDCFALRVGETIAMHWVNGCGKRVALTDIDTVIPNDCNHKFFQVIEKPVCAEQSGSHSPVDTIVI